MNLVIAVIPLIIIVLVSAIVVRISSVMLKMTGLDEKTAKFQAMSAFTGTGFTTKDSEFIVGHEQRRRIITVLMILGNAGIVSVITTLVLSFVQGGSGVKEIATKMVFIIFALLIVYRLVSHKGLTKRINRMIENKIAQTKILERKPLSEILGLPKGYGIYEINVDESFKEVGLTLGESGLRSKELLVLSIEKKDRLISSPKADDRIASGDKIICYGLKKSIEGYLPEEAQ